MTTERPEQASGALQARRRERKRDDAKQRRVAVGADDRAPCPSAKARCHRVGVVIGLTRVGRQAKFAAQ